MQNSFDPNGRGWSDQQLLLGGAVMLVAIAVITGCLLAKSKGVLDRRVSVTAELINVGDGLPDRADVKFRGVLVGAVTGVEPAEGGRPNIVHIDLKPDAAVDIPDSVTARVVPSNVFAVSSVQLIDHGGSGHLSAGSVVAEDADRATVLFQTTINRLRELLVSTAGGGDDPPIGMIGLIAESTNGRGDRLLSAGARLQRILSELNRLVAANPEDPSMLSTLSEMSRTLDRNTPDLLDNLENALVPMRTIAENESQIRGLMSAGLDTAARSATALDNHIDQLIGITTHLEPVVGVFAQNSDQLLPIATRLTRLSEKGFDQTWNPDRQSFRANIILSFTPLWTYVRSDCPRYGALEGPSCHTAPETRQWFDIPEVLLPGSYKPPPDLAPPSGTPLPPVDATPSDASLGDPPAVAPGPGDPSAPAGATVAPSAYRGNVGPVGSPGEKRQLSLILGEDVNSAQELMLGPLARGTAVAISSDPAEAGAR